MEGGVTHLLQIGGRRLGKQSQLPKGVNPSLVCVTNTDVPHHVMTVGPDWKQARPGSGTRPLCDRSDEKSAKVLKSEYESFPTAQHLSVKGKKGWGGGAQTLSSSICQIRHIKISPERSWCQVMGNFRKIVSKEWGDRER